MALAIGAGVLGVVLNQLFDRTERIINQAEAAGERTLVRTGIQVRQTIDYAKDAYRGLMGETMDRVEGCVAGAIAQIGVLVTELEGKGAHDLKELADRAVVAANILPFSDKRPQLGGCSPRYVFRLPGETKPIEIQVIGNFPTPGDDRVPTLTFGGAASVLSQRQVVRLEFRANPAAVFPALATASGITHQEGDLVVPWTRDALGGLRADRLLAVFRVSIAALPPSPGQVTLRWTTTRTEEIAARTLVEHYHLCSEKECAKKQHDCGGNNDRTRNWTIDADPDCWITGHQLSGSSADTIAHGDFGGPTCTVDSRSRVVYSGTTSYHGPFGQSGRIDGKIWVHQKTKKTITDHHEEEFPLGWREEKFFPHPLGTWRISFKDFRGNHLEFTGPRTSDFLKVESDARGLHLTPKIPVGLVAD